MSFESLSVDFIRKEDEVGCAIILGSDVKYEFLGLFRILINSLAETNVELKANRFGANLLAFGAILIAF